MARGPKARLKPPPPREPTPAETLAEILASAPAEMQQEMIDGLRRRACGLRWWAGETAPPGARGQGVLRRRVRVEDLDSGEEVLGWIYELPPDVQAAKLLIEHGSGRPAVRQTEKSDLTVEVRHFARPMRTGGPAAAGDGEGAAAETFDPDGSDGARETVWTEAPPWETPEPEDDPLEKLPEPEDGDLEDEAVEDEE